MTITHLRALADFGLWTDILSGTRPPVDGDQPAILALRALALAATGRVDEALPLVEPLLARERVLDPGARLDLAAACLAVRKKDIARRMLGDLLSNVPDHPLALARLAACDIAEGRLEAALVALDRSLAQEPDRLTAQMQRMRVAMSRRAEDAEAAQRAIDAAAGALQRLHDRLPGSVVADCVFQVRGAQIELWVAAGNLAEAESWLDTRRETLPAAEWAALVALYARKLSASDRHAQAEDALRAALNLHPDHVPLIVELAELAQAMGRNLQAAALLHRAIRAAIQQGKPSVSLWVRLSQACLHQSFRKARHAAVRARDLAAALEPDETLDAAAIANLRLQARHALADVELQAGSHDAAIAEFHEMLAEDPDFLPALTSLGQALMQKGEIERAIETYEKLSELDPVKGHTALISARRFPEDDRTLDMLERAARRPGIHGSVRGGLLFQLAAAWEKRRDYDRAFALVDEANAATRKTLRYSATEHRNRCARIRARFTRRFIESRQACGNDSELPVFVVGMPRSGTTLVEQILAGHSQVHGAGELGLIPQVLAGMDRWERRVGSGRGWPDCVDDLSPGVAKRVSAALIEELQGYAPGARRVVDKLPHNFENIGLIKLLFPKARIISVRRDPRDIAISNYFTDYQARHSGMGFAYNLGDIGEQLADHNMLMHHWAALFPGEILEVRYEDVVDDTEGQARRMLDYLGLDWEPQVLAFNELDRPVKTASIWQVRQPIYGSSKAKWTRYAAHLGPLIAGTNAPIRPAPTDDMVHLPEPGLLQAAYAAFQAGALDEAEYGLKKLLHHLPDHAAARFVLGAIYLRKGYGDEGVELMEAALDRCPWNRAWRAALARACDQTGRTARAAELRAAPSGSRSVGPELSDPDESESVFTTSAEAEA